MSKSYQPPDRSTYDPGWNDPPPMPTAAPVAAKPRTSLNKRIAFPMQSGTGASSPSVKTTAEGLPLPFSTAKYQPPSMNSTLPEESLAQATLPPPPPVTFFNPNEASPPADQPISSDETFDSVAARDFCQSIFLRSIEAMSSAMDETKLTELRKRIELLNEMWSTDKLDVPVQRILYELGQALDKIDLNAAKEQHRLLVTLHMNVSAQWATALRQIIHSLSADESESSNETGPVVLPDNEINVVQFMDVNARPDVHDAIASPFQQAPIDPIAMPIEPLPLSNENIQNDVETYDSQPNESNAPKPRSGRFGPILHL